MNHSSVVVLVTSTPYCVHWFSGCSNHSYQSLTFHITLTTSLLAGSERIVFTSIDELACGLASTSKVLLPRLTWKVSFLDFSVAFVHIVSGYDLKTSFSRYFLDSLHYLLLNLHHLKRAQRNIGKYDWFIKMLKLFFSPVFTFPFFVGQVEWPRRAHEQSPLASNRISLESIMVTMGGNALETGHFLTLKIYKLTP